MLSEKSRKLSVFSGITKEKIEDVGYNLDFFMQDFWPVKGRFTRVVGPLLQFLDEKPQYSDDINNMVSPASIEIGKSFDIIPLLSFNGKSNFLVRNNGDPDPVVLDEDTFKGKHVMVCCFQVPILLYDDQAIYFQSVATMCYEKYDSGDNDFEMVVVAKMKTKANYQRVFDHFLSAFPPSCLVVPFDDPKRRDYICCSLGLTHSCKCFVLDSSGIVLLNKFPPNFAIAYGADAFPFTVNSKNDLDSKDKPRWKTASTTQLEQLLGCTEFDVLDRVNSKGVREEVPVWKLKEKVVGLYLCDEEVTGTIVFSPSFISTLNKVYEECKAQQRDFEIVVAYIPFAYCLDPETFQKNLDNFMKHHKMSWWRMPFNNSKCHRLDRLVDFAGEQLIIIGPQNKYVDPCGKEILNYYGVDAYPFTRKGLIEMQASRLRALTLKSFLVYESRDYVLKGTTCVPVEDLQPSNIIVYFGCFDDRELLAGLQTWRGTIKSANPDFEVIFVRRNYREHEDTNRTEPELSSLCWLECPFNSEHSTFLEKKLFTKCDRQDTLIAFGSDGHVCSIKAQELLSADNGPGNFPFNDNIDKEVCSRLDEIHPFLFEHML